MHHMDAAPSIAAHTPTAIFGQRNNRELLASVWRRLRLRMIVQAGNWARCEPSNLKQCPTNGPSCPKNALAETSRVLDFLAPFPVWT
jgi:hypothetical protein